jgi:hypothetical protein
MILLSIGSERRVRAGGYDDTATYTRHLYVLLAANKDHFCLQARSLAALGCRQDTSWL